MGAYTGKNYTRALIVTPVSSLSVWEDEEKLLGLGKHVLTLDHGTAAQKAAAVRAFGDGWIVTNYETFWRPELLPHLQGWGPQYLIWDEFQRLRYHTSKQSKEAMKVRQWKTVRAAVGLSGTPITRGYEGLFGMFRAVDPNLFGTNYSRFAARYLNIVNMGDYNKVVGYKNLDELKAKLDSRMIQISKSEALPWLLKPRDQPHWIELSPTSRKRYREFAREATMQISGYKLNEALDTLDERPTIGNALARIQLTTLVRLQQLTSGFIKTEDEGELIVSDEKLVACIDLTRTLRDSDESVVIFYAWNMDRKRLSGALAKELKEQIEVLHGNMAPREQKAALDRFLAKKTRVLLCQIQKAVGVNQMVASHHAIFYSTGYSLEYFIQAKGRLDRAGQTEPVLFHHLLVKQSVDEKVYSVLRSNVDLARQFLKLDYCRQFFSDDAA